MLINVTLKKILSYVMRIIKKNTMSLLSIYNNRTVRKIHYKEYSYANTKQYIRKKYVTNFKAIF